ncbi:uncharacterized protein KQ657_000750 [Scheffersomyces spartinae]|uniref:Histone deacetylase complex subunit SAP30 Sin3 binding domain-containing protein n=1 Tax=Scheffersomyces spartinae TaxID=45513 RepID=A0A9P8AI74_9ASCO|nr:uncharacterized protein KQ657_000750 [Scheffersomyces spartinae]KAG7193334.1 hypothetical protein KQ657_000750 [Scheffersomyces spartinae]
MARGKDSASETEPKLASSRTSQKQKNLQAQQEFLAKYIHSNGPKNTPPTHPLDFEALPTLALEKYNVKYGLRLPQPLSLTADMLNSELGKKTYSYKKNNRGKISKPELANEVKKHFLALPAKENEIITNFLYTVKNQEKDFKLSFK